MRFARALLGAAASAVAIAAPACGGASPIAPIVPRLAVSKILAFGDSLTEGDATPDQSLPAFAHPTADPGPAKGYPYKLLSLLSARYPNEGIQVFNGGYGGRFLSDDATDQPDRTLDEFLDAFHPDLMILMHGANDLNQPNPNVGTIASFAARLVDKAQGRGVRVILSSLPPRISGGTPPRAANPEFVVPYNAALAQVAAAKGVPYVDVYTPIVQSLSGPDIAPDGLHLTQTGNDKLAGIYFTALKYLYETNK